MWVSIDPAIGKREKKIRFVWCESPIWRFLCLSIFLLTLTIRCSLICVWFFLYNIFRLVLLKCSTHYFSMNLGIQKVVFEIHAKSFSFWVGVGGSCILILQINSFFVHPPQQIHALPNRSVILLGLLYSQEFHSSLVVFYSFSVRIVILWIVLRYSEKVWLYTAKK